MSELTGHTTATLTDHLSQSTLHTETWDMPFTGLSGDFTGDLRIIRMQREGSGDDYDELVMTANAESKGSNWTYLWSSDPEYPFATEGMSHALVFQDLPNDICDLIEKLTGLNMEEARP